MHIFIIRSTRLLPANKMLFKTPQLNYVELYAKGTGISSQKLEIVETPAHYNILKLSSPRISLHKCSKM